MTTDNSCIKEDALITGLMAARNKQVEVFAFGISYVGTLSSIDTENGVITVTEGEDSVMLELERIDHFNPLEE